MRNPLKNYLPTVACALTPLLWYIVIRPYAEIGINDEWAYVKTTQVLAQTGHLIYNGWGTPILGWQAYLGALFIKLFGFSFTTVHFTTVIVAMATAFLLQRTFVRTGINQWNATLATLTFVLSPLCLPLTFTFMNDVPGAFGIVLCLYMCLRALQAERERAAMAWIGSAVLLNMVAGTARQLAWLGVLVMVPCTLWLLRRSRRALAVGSVCCIIGIGFVAAVTHWYAQQPYAIPLSPIPEKIDWKSLKLLTGQFLAGIGNLALLTLPVLLVFAGSFRSWTRRIAAMFAIGILCWALLEIALIHGGSKLVWLAPFINDWVTADAFERLNAIAAQGIHLDVARSGLPVLLTAAIVVGLLSLIACSFVGASGDTAPQRKGDSISWPQLVILLGPFSVAYIVPLVSRALLGQFYDRYLLPLFVLLLLVLVRWYQERVKENLPLATILLIGLFGLFGIAATHDRFALYGGYADAIGEVESTGMPATAILGPWEFEGWTEVERVGYTNHPGIHLPKGAYVPPPARVFPAGCKTAPAGFSKALAIDFQNAYSVNFLDWTPAIKPVYAVSVDPELCGGQLALTPVTYRTWIPPHFNSVYVVRLPGSFPN